MTSIVQLANVRVIKTQSDQDVPVAAITLPEAAEVKTTNGSDQTYTLDVPVNPSLYYLRVAVTGDTGVYVAVGATASATVGVACPPGGVYDFALTGATAGAAYHIIDIA